MAGKLSGKVALVTGGARGIGLACATRFAQDGAKVVMADLLADEGEAAAADLRKAGHEAKFFAGDLTQRAVVDKLTAFTIEAFGGVDILLSNAGIARSTPFLEVTDEEFDQVLAINLRAAFMGGQSVARQMVSQGRGGVIINMSSVNALVAIPGMVGYACSKGAMRQLTNIMAIELAPHKIRVVAIGPGTILTELARDAVLKDKAARDKVLSRTPIGRAGEPEEVASVASFLASDDASYITGQTIYPDGGRLALNYTVPVPED